MKKAQETQEVTTPRGAENPIGHCGAGCTHLLPKAPVGDMGGGNGQKAKTARERNAAKLASAGKGSQLDSNKKAMNIQCKVCMQTFMCTTSEEKCKEHAEAKHPKHDLTLCFPHLKK